MTSEDRWIHDVNENIIAFDCLCHLRDRVILIPDHWYLRAHGYISWIYDIDIANIRYPWGLKRAQTVFRGADSGYRRILIENLEDDENLDISYSLQHTRVDGHCAGINCRTARRVRRMNKNRSRGVHTPMAWKEMLAYRGLLDLDGFSNSWPGTFWKLRSNSVVLKQESPWCQWYYNRLVPFVHYIPIKNNLSDIHMWTRWVADERNAESAQQMASAATQLISTLSTEKALHVLESRMRYI